MQRMNWWILTLAIVATLSFVNASFGDDDESASKGNSNNNRANNASSDEGVKAESRKQADRSDNDDTDALHHAALGVSLQEYDGHVRVIAVMPGSPASKAGLRVGDEIRAVGDQKIRTTEGLVEEIGEYQPGRQIELSIRRNGERRTLSAKLVSTQELTKAGWDRGQQDSEHRGTSYSYRPGVQQDQPLSEHIRALQQRISRMQQELNELQASLGNHNQGNARRNNSAQVDTGAQAGNTSGQRQGFTGSQQSYYNGRRPSMMDRTDLRYSTGRGFSRDHGPRETPSGNNANED